jgi:hypothetical protein
MYWKKRSTQVFLRVSCGYLRRAALTFWNLLGKGRFRLKASWNLMPRKAIGLSMTHGTTTRALKRPRRLNGQRPGAADVHPGRCDYVARPKA